MEVAVVVAVPLVASAAGAFWTYVAGRRERRENDKSIAKIFSVVVASERTRYRADNFWDALAERVDDRYEVQCVHFGSALRQSTTYFYFSMGVATIGFALLSAGIGLALVGSIPVGTVSIIGGVLADVAATLVFRQANRAKSDAQANLSDIARAIEQDEKYLMAYKCLSQIQDSSVRDATHAIVARQLIGVLGHVGAAPAGNGATGGIWGTESSGGTDGQGGQPGSPAARSSSGGTGNTGHHG